MHTHVLFLSHFLSIPMHEFAAPSFRSQPQDQCCREGDTVAFECAVEGWPEPELLWLANGGRPLPQSRNFCAHFDGQCAILVIRDARLDHCGEYTVRLSNDHGQAEAKCRLMVSPDPDKDLVSPAFQAVIKDANCTEGDTVKFKAVLTGDPLPQVEWFLNGAPLPQSEKVHCVNDDSICLLTIREVDAHFQGSIRCQGTNRLGKDVCEARLRVRAKGEGQQTTTPLMKNIC